MREKGDGIEAAKFVIEYIEVAIFSKVSSPFLRSIISSYVEKHIFL